MPEAIVVVVVILAVVTLGLAGLATVRKFISRDRLAQYTDVSGYVYAVIGVLYAVILAQVVVAAWEDYRDARGFAAAEANAVLSLDRLSRSWPEPVRQPVHDGLIAYARQVVDIEWPAMARGPYTPPPSVESVSDLWDAYGVIGQGAEGGGPFFSASLEQLDNLGAARRERFLLAEGSLPPSMTLTLLLGAAVTVGFSYLFAIEDGWLHGLITSSLAILVALLLMLQYQLETPFRGVDSIEPTAMQSVLTEIEAQGR